ncbi:hypothetical protein ABIA33_003853 [Streptacidiphilus sp. MAP12-16]|uniref:HNH endonuclease signature motif containing protein n=1 Tax=Streptacidiphilus sp. MAP12-16 TaxID=3156300 RepID=UPI00351989E9
MTTQTKYTRELLTELAAQSKSINEMMRRLGVPMAGGTHSYLSKRLKHYDIDTSHFTHLGRPDYGRRSYSREELVDAAANSTSIRSLMDHLGVEPYDSAYSYLKKRLAHFGICTSHFTPGQASPLGVPTVISRDELTRAVASNRSISGVMRELRLPDSTTARRRIKHGIGQFNLDTSHFTGRAYSRGLIIGPRRKPEDLLVKLSAGSRRPKGEQLRNMLISIGWEEICAECGTGPEWRGRLMTLELDHIDGDWLNNTPSNLRLLCPNCHATTDTYCGRNKLHLRG